MENGKMANVDAAAVMHDGQWLKISDRDEVNDLTNQISDLKKNEWKEATISGLESDSCNILVKLYDTGMAHVVGTFNTPVGYDLKRMEEDGITIQLDGVYFNGTKDHQVVNIDNQWATTYMHAYSGHLTVYINVENPPIPGGTTLPINTMEPYHYTN